jgi:hypothetical protein
MKNSVFILTLIPLALALGSTPGAAQETDRLNPTAEISGGIGNGEALGALDFFLPLYATADEVLFGNLRGYIAEDGIRQGSIGFGYRFPADEVWTFGINGFLDYQHSAEDHDYGQFGVGIEALSVDWEFRANAYLPLGDRHKGVNDANAALIESGRLVFRAGQETALHGADAEIGYRIPLLPATDLTQIKAFAGGYWYDGDGIESIPGASGRVEFSHVGLPVFGQDSSLTLVAGASYDDERGENGTLLARLRIPFGNMGKRRLDDPLYRRVERADVIRTHVGATGDAEAAIFAETGQTAGKVVRIAEGDTAAAINEKLAAAGDGALILAAGKIDLDNPLQLGTGQFLLGGGGSLAVRGAGSGGAAVFRSKAAAATLTGTSETEDIVTMNNRSAIAGLAMRGGEDAIGAKDVDDIVVRDVDIAETVSDGIALVNVDRATITRTSIHDLVICENATECEYSIFDPDVIHHAAISALDVRDLVLRDIDISDVTYGLFIGSRHEEIDWELVTPDPSRNITVENLTLVNSRREGILLVNVEDAALRNVSIDNSAMERSMDLVVLQKSSRIDLEGMSLKGGINGLMFASSFNLPGATSDISVRDVVIEGSSRSGVFMNPASNVRFSNVTIIDPGAHGFYLYGDPWGFAGGPIADVSFDNVMVRGSGDAAVYIAGPIHNFDGDIGVEAVPSRCSADASPGGGTELTQDAGQVFSIGGQTVPAGTLNATCGL